MTSHLGSHGTNDMKPEMLPGVQTENGIQHVEYNIIYVALRMCTRTEKTTFKGKDDNC